MSTNEEVIDINDILRDKIEEVLNIWADSYPEVKSWWRKLSVSWGEIVDFLVRVGDYFIRAIDDLLVEGKDKKATVMNALEEIYDNIVPPMMPLLLRPFNRPIKAFIFNMVISNFVDYFVAKYRANEWDMSNKTTFI